MKNVKKRFEESGVMDATPEDRNSYEAGHLFEMAAMVRDMLDPVRPGYVPSKSAYVESLIKDNELDITTIKKAEYDTRTIDVMAYTYRSYRGKYTVFVKDGVSAEAFAMLDLHEKGHIVFNHMTGREAHKKHFSDLISSKWSKIKDKFTDEAKKRFKKEKLIEYVFDKFANVAQDMEINSKLFDDWKSFNDTIYREELLYDVREAKRLFDVGLDVLSEADYNKFAGYFDTVRTAIELKTLHTAHGEEPPKNKDGSVSEQVSQYCHPSNEGWPEKLDWIVYMQFLMNDIENWVQKIASCMDGQPKKNPNGSGDKSGGKISSKDVDGKDAESDAIKDSAESERIDDGEFQDDDFDFDTGKGDEHDGGVVGYVDECTKFEDLLKILRKKCMQKKSRRLFTDVLYNSNRNKHHGVVIPRRTYKERYVPGSITILLDVSGSVPTDLVTKVVKSIVNSTGIFDPHGSHLVQWDTRLCSDTLLTEDRIDIRRGGGTEMGEGMSYCSKYQKRALDKFFIISDGEDDLSTAWIKEGSKLPGYKCFIGYRVKSDQTKDEWLSEKLSGYRGSSEDREKFLSVFDVVLLSVNSREAR